MLSSCTADEPAKRKTPDKDWWSLKPVVRPTIPQVKNAIRVRNPIDAFILAKLEARGLGFSAEAERVTLIRRLTIRSARPAADPGGDRRLRQGQRRRRL